MSCRVGVGVREVCFVVVIQVLERNFHAFGNEGVQKSPESRRIVTFRPPCSEELKEEGNQMAPLNPI